MKLLIGAIALVCISACGPAQRPPAQRALQQLGFRAALQEVMSDSYTDDCCRYYRANELIITWDPAEEVERSLAENDLRLIAIYYMGPLYVPGVEAETKSLPTKGVWIVPGLNDAIESRVYERLITEFADSYNKILMERLSTSELGKVTVGPDQGD